MNIQNYLDSTYLKTPEQSGLSEAETAKIIVQLVQDAIDHDIFAVMIRPNYIKMAKDIISHQKSKVKIGTVIGFHEGTYTIEQKFAEAEKAIKDGADELDFVINYQEFLNRNLELVENEILRCTALCLLHNKVAKWIIEIAALSDDQIAEITSLISTLVTENFPGKENMVYVKSSTGFYQTPNGEPNGATIEGINIMLSRAGKLPVKAAGGVASPKMAEEMIALGVKRIGTSSALALTRNEETSSNY